MVSSTVVNPTQPVGCAHQAAACPAVALLQVPCLLCHRLGELSEVGHTGENGHAFKLH